jgi:hypothetical protein
MKRFIFFLFYFLIISQYGFSAETLSQERTVSLLTSSPTDDEIYTAWGHTAVRVKIPAEGTDVVFNYGIFAFDDDFLYKFVKGETDYRLAVWDFESALEEARDDKNVFMYEQELNLTETEKDALITALWENHKPQNRYYRYNFFFDNCATRPLWQIEKAVGGEIHYPAFNNTYTFRDLIYRKLVDSPWFAFGIDICLGSETDRVITDRELLFLPEELMHSLAGSSIETGDSIRSLVSQTNVLNHPDTSIMQKKGITSVFTPMIVCWMLFFLIAVHTIFYNFKKKQDLWLDVMLFFVYGMLGCLVFFLTFFSEHPCTNPNYNLLWINPLQLAFAFLALFRKLRKTLVYYQILNILLLLAAVIGWHFIPQHYNSAFFPLILILIIRSANYIYHYRK